ncbi:MAG: ABC transporter ATP-binding protein, partial [Pseudonocardiaceae bacterium]
MRLRGAAGPGSPSGSEPGLIGVDDLKTPSWAQVDETILGAGMSRMVCAAPVALGLLVRLAWRTSPRLTVLAAAAELLTGCATAFG